MVDLDGTVDEVKENIRNASNPDYEELLKKEEEGKNRKTIIEFLEKKIGEEVEEDIDKSKEEQVEDELVEEIEEETEDGLLGGFTPPQLLTGGALAGILVGLIAGAFLLPGAGGNDVSPAAAQSTVQDLLGENQNNVTVGQAEKVNGLYRVPLTQEVTQGNETTTQTQNYYLTVDGEKLIPESIQTAFGQQRPVVLDVEQIRESQRQQEQNQTTSNQSPETESPEGENTSETSNTTQ